MEPGETIGAEWYGNRYRARAVWKSERKRRSLIRESQPP
jgi:hypothetical protein